MAQDELPSEQRSRPRIALDIPCRLIADNATWHGRAIDATLGGLQLACRGPFEEGQSCSVVLEQPNESIRLRGDIVHVQEENVGVALAQDVQSSRALFTLLLDTARAQNDEAERMVQRALASSGQHKAHKPKKGPQLISLNDPLDSDPNNPIPEK